MVTSQMSAPQKDVTEFLLHTMLFISFLSFLSPTFPKKKFLSPEIDFIHLVHIIHHWIIKWAVGGEFGTWIPIHVSAVKGLCGLEQGFIYKLRA